LRHVFALAFAAITAFGCATAQDGKPDPLANAALVAKAEAAPASSCTPAPKDLVVKDINPGTGQAVRFRSGITVGYTGWVYDGCRPDFKGVKFDSSEGRPTPFGFVVGAGRVIKGWDEGAIGMKEKGKRLLIIPPDKAYGDREMADGKIAPNSTLVFEVDLFQIVYQPGEPAAK
jgi:FKBP-type peptidyl-prolyl cis-trans isomerase FkpA